LVQHPFSPAMREQAVHQRDVSARPNSEVQVSILGAPTAASPSHLQMSPSCLSCLGDGL
jgi:hypothetical protein